MTLGQIIFWILVIILLIIVFKISIVIFWIILIIAIIYFIIRAIKSSQNESYHPTDINSTNVPFVMVQDVTNNNINKPDQDYLDSFHISEYCVHKRLQEGNDLNYAIAHCSLPQSESSKCFDSQYYKNTY